MLAFPCVPQYWHIPFLRLKDGTVKVPVASRSASSSRMYSLAHLCGVIMVDYWLNPSGDIDIALLES